MKKKIYLISTSVLKENSVICANVDDSLLLNAIIEAQDIELQQTLGTQLYNRILNDIDEDSLAGDYKSLVDDYCQNFVCYFAVYHAIPSISIKIKNKGTVRENSEWSQDSTFQEMSYLRKDIQDKAEFYAQRLSDYLQANKDSFPEYKANCGCCGDVAPKRNQYRSGLVLEDCKCKRSYNIVDITL